PRLRSSRGSPRPAPAERDRRAPLAVHRPRLIAGWFLGTVSFRVLIVWLYNSTGRSVFAATLFHMTFNVSWQLFPVHGSHFDPRVTGMIFSFAAVVVVLIWGPRSLRRSAKSH